MMKPLPGEVPFEQLINNDKKFRALVWTGVGVLSALCLGGAAYAAFFMGR
jgi:hypothetical protein